MIDRFLDWFRSLFEPEPHEYVNVAYNCSWCGFEDKVVAKVLNYPWFAHDGIDIIKERGWKNTWFTKGLVCIKCLKHLFAAAVVPNVGDSCLVPTCYTELAKCSTGVFSEYRRVYVAPAKIE